MFWNALPPEKNVFTALVKFMTSWIGRLGNEYGSGIIDPDDSVVIAKLEILSFESRTLNPPTCVNRWTA